jgi:molybdopterin synthase catalytic subunit
MLKTAPWWSSMVLCATTRAGGQRSISTTRHTKKWRRLAAEVKERLGVRQVTMVHRLGRLQIGETSVLIVVASAHRAQAFDACRWLIDTLKQTVPIWKKETFADGEVWAPGEPFPPELQVSQAEAKHE